MPLTGAVQGIVIFGVVLWYSTVVWRTIDHHFRDEFKKHLAKEYKQNKHMKINDDEVVSDPPETTATPLPEPRSTTREHEEAAATCSAKTILQEIEEVRGDDADGVCRIDETSENRCGQ